MSQPPGFQRNASTPPSFFGSRKLFFRIFLWFWLAMVLVSMAGLVLSVTSESGPLVSAWRQETGQSLKLFGQTALIRFREGGAEALHRFMSSVEDGQRARVLLLNAQGEELTGRAVSPRVLKVAAKSLRSGEMEFRFFLGRGVVAQAFTDEPDSRRYVIVKEHYRKTFGDFVARMKALGSKLLVAFLVSGAVCYLLARRLTAPIGQLRDVARRIADGDLSVRVGMGAAGKGDEIAQLAGDFDRMAERTESLLTEQKRLVRDISHELRSPLARLHVALELARRNAGEGAATALDRIEREAVRLNGLIAQLLDMERMEAERDCSGMEPVDLAALVEAAAADGSFEGEARRCTVKATVARGGGESLSIEQRSMQGPAPGGSPGSEQASTPGPAQAPAMGLASSSSAGPAPGSASGRAPGEYVVLGWPERLRSAVENVVRNAVRYTAEGTEVEISLYCEKRREGRFAVIRVRDRGPGVPEESLALLFRPFYRVGEDRGRGSGGTGLGLAITERAARLHGGSVSAANAPGGGLLVELAVPMPEGE